MSSVRDGMEPKMAHVNLMVDTIVANLPEDGLRSVMRSMLAMDPSITSVFEDRTRSYLKKTVESQIKERYSMHEASGSKPSNQLRKMQQTTRAMLGCGMCYESIPILTHIVVDTLPTKLSDLDETSRVLSAVDGDIIQVLTAIQKTLFTDSGSRPFSTRERFVLEQLNKTLKARQLVWLEMGRDYPFERSLDAVDSLLHEKPSIPGAGQRITIPPLPSMIETFTLGDKLLPRLFSGLWQLSSPSWGTPSLHSIMEQFSAHATHCFTAYDMADHYGDAEALFGNFRSSCENPSALFGATKYCIFMPTNVTREIIRANITERCRRMSAEYIDLLQFHWQDYDDKQYITALQHLQDDPRVLRLGLCNFDTLRTSEILSAGIGIFTNQVQFSLIDSRPLCKMGPLCVEKNIKLLTYGTLCGGFLAEKWLLRHEPLELFSAEITPSQRKYYEMILNWGGWSLFQELLHVLDGIAAKHGVSIANVATRWVLDFPFVGAVIVGTRMGVSDNAERNLKTYGWRLNDEDQSAIEAVLAKSRRDQMVEILGDCGGEYR